MTAERRLVEVAQVRPGDVVLDLAPDAPSLCCRLHARLAQLVGRLATTSPLECSRALARPLKPSSWRTRGATDRCERAGVRVRAAHARPVQFHRPFSQICLPSCVRFASCSSRAAWLASHAPVSRYRGGGGANRSLVRLTRGMVGFIVDARLTSTAGANGARAPCARGSRSAGARTRARGRARRARTHAASPLHRGTRQASLSARIR